MHRLTLWSELKTLQANQVVLESSAIICILIIIIMYIYHALINALSAPLIHINLNMIFYTHVEHSPTKTIYIKYYRKQNKTALQTHTQ